MRNGMTTSFVSEIKESLFRNAIVFLNAAVGDINRGLREDDSNELLAILHTQMAVEAALKAYIIENFGIKLILHSKYENLCENDIEKAYYNNELKVKEFDSLKNFTKREQSFLKFDSSRYKYLERFQNYRNKLIHFNYSFSPEEKQKMEKDIIYVIAHILGALMGNGFSRGQRIFMQDYLHEKEYKILIENPLYFNELVQYLQEEYNSVYMCPICSNRTLTPEKKCLICLEAFNDKNAFRYVDCGYCGEKMVIYDALNISINQNMIRGLCLNCKNDTTVYQCPMCDNSVNLEMFEKDKCKPNYCNLFD